MIDIYKNFVPVWVTVNSDVRYKDHLKDSDKTGAPRYLLRYQLFDAAGGHVLSLAGTGSTEPQLWDTGELSSCKALLNSSWVDFDSAYAAILSDDQGRATMILPYPYQYNRHLPFLRCLKPLTPEDAAELKSLLRPENFRQGKIDPDAEPDFVYTRISPEIEAEFIRQEVPLIEDVHGLRLWRAVPFHRFSDIPESYQLIGLYPMWRGTETIYEVVCKGVTTGLMYLTACSNGMNARRNNVHAGAFAALVPMLCGTDDSSAYAVSAFCGVRVERTPEAVIYDPEASLSSETSKIIRAEFFRRTKLFQRSPRDLLPAPELAEAVARDNTAPAPCGAVPGRSDDSDYAVSQHRHPELNWTLDRAQTRCSNSLKSTACPLPSTLARTSNISLEGLFDYNTDTLYLDAPSWNDTQRDDRDWEVMVHLLQHYGISRLIIKEGQGPLCMKMFLRDHGIKVCRTYDDIVQQWLPSHVHIPIPEDADCGADDLIAAIEHYLETYVMTTCAGNGLTPRSARLWALCRCLEYRFREYGHRIKFYPG